MQNQESNNSDRRTLNTTILSLLEENRDDMKHLHDCMHETKDIVTSVRQHFIGITPEDHIRDHNLIAEELRVTTNQKNVFRNILGTVIAAFVIGLGTLLYAAGSDFITAHVKVEYVQTK